MTGAARTTPQRIADFALVAMFLSAIAAPALKMLIVPEGRQVAETELRKPAEFPRVRCRPIGPFLWPKKQTLMQFPQQFETWFDDHVGFRRPLIRCYNVAKVCGVTVENGITVGEASHVQVIVGRNGWLYGSSGGFLVRDFRRTDPFTQADLTAWRRCLTQRRDWLSARNIGYAYLVTPNQQTIYPEYMPRAMTRADRPSRLDQLLAEMAQVPGFDFPDLRPTLTEGRAVYPTYHQTDTHWNDFGAYLGYRELMAVMKRSIATAPIAPLESFEIEAKQVTNYGDLCRSLNAPIDFEQTLVTLKPRTPRQTQWESFETPSSVFKVWKSTNSLAPSGRLVVVHDSFMMALRPYLSEHFREVYYIMTYDFPADLIAELKPDFVLDQMVERVLMYPVPVNPPQMYVPSQASPAVLFASDPRAGAADGVKR
jgi:alginate O-acetyltransferase complex protein AlgJ